MITHNEILVHFRLFSIELCSLLHLAKCCIFLLDNLCAKKAVMSGLTLHSNVARLVDGHVVLNDKGVEDGAVGEIVFKRALAILMCATYRNQLLNVFVRPSLVAVALQMTRSFRKGTLGWL